MHCTPKVRQKTFGVQLFYCFLEDFYFFILAKRTTLLLSSFNDFTNACVRFRTVLERSFLASYFSSVSFSCDGSMLET